MDKRSVYIQPVNFPTVPRDRAAARHADAAAGDATTRIICWRLWPLSGLTTPTGAGSRPWDGVG